MSILFVLFEKYQNFRILIMSKEDVIQSLIASYAEAYQNLGYSSLMGKIVALLLAAPEPLSLDEITQQLQMSKGPVSQIARKLKEHQLIEKVWIPGERKDFYRASDNIFGQAFFNYSRSMKRNSTIAQQHLEKIDNATDRDDQLMHLKNRLSEMEAFYKLMDVHFQQFLREWKEHKAELITP